jgi:hypothetical protein
MTIKAVFLANSAAFLLEQVLHSQKFWSFQWKSGGTDEGFARKQERTSRHLALYN